MWVFLVFSFTLAALIAYTTFALVRKRPLRSSPISHSSVKVFGSLSGPQSLIGSIRAGGPAGASSAAVASFPASELDAPAPTSQIPERKQDPQAALSTADQEAEHKITDGTAAPSVAPLAISEVTDHPSVSGIIEHLQSIADTNATSSFFPFNPFLRDLFPYLLTFFSPRMRLRVLSLVSKAWRRETLRSITMLPNRSWKMISLFPSLTCLDFENIRFLDHPNFVLPDLPPSLTSLSLPMFEPARVSLARAYTQLISRPMAISALYIEVGEHFDEAQAVLQMFASSLRSLSWHDNWTKPPKAAQVEDLFDSIDLPRLESLSLFARGDVFRRFGPRISSQLTHLDLVQSTDLGATNFAKLTSLTLSRALTHNFPPFVSQLASRLKKLVLTLHPGISPEVWPYVTCVWPSTGDNAFPETEILHMLSMCSTKLTYHYFQIVLESHSPLMYLLRQITLNEASAFYKLFTANKHWPKLSSLNLRTEQWDETLPPVHSLQGLSFPILEHLHWNVKVLGLEGAEAAVHIAAAAPNLRYLYFRLPSCRSRKSDARLEELVAVVERRGVETLAFGYMWDTQPDVKEIEPYETEAERTQRAAASYCRLKDNRILTRVGFCNDSL